MSSPGFTHFGYQQVPTEEKKTLVHNVFEKVSSSYDLMNDVMSLGVHRLWKRRFIQMISAKSGEYGLDMAGGTGDIAYGIVKRCPGVQLLVADINAHMLEEGKKRFSHVPQLSWNCVNAEELPFEDRSFDFYSIAFGIRNVTDIQKALHEAYRVLKPGGRFFCLEFSLPAEPFIKQIYDLYSFYVIPEMGKWVAKDRDSYQYLVESIRQFPKPARFKQMIQTAGFELVHYMPMSAGIVHIHHGVKL